MKKKRELRMVAVYFDEDEYEKFRLLVLARDVSQSAYVREQLGFDIKPHGWTRQKRGAKILKKV